MLDPGQPQVDRNSHLESLARAPSSPFPRRGHPQKQRLLRCVGGGTAPKVSPAQALAPANMSPSLAKGS